MCSIQIEMLADYEHYLVVVFKLLGIYHFSFRPYYKNRYYKNKTKDILERKENKKKTINYSSILLTAHVYFLNPDV